MILISIKVIKWDKSLEKVGNVHGAMSRLWLFAQINFIAVK